MESSQNQIDSKKDFSSQTQEEMTTTLNPPCSICFDEMIGDMACPTKCGHVFHGKCLEDLVKVARQQHKTAKCPMCRKEFLEGNIIKLHFAVQQFQQPKASQVHSILLRAEARVKALQQQVEDNSGKVIRSLNKQIDDKGYQIQALETNISLFARDLAEEKKAGIQMYKISEQIKKENEDLVAELKEKQRLLDKVEKALSLHKNLVQDYLEERTQNINQIADLKHSLRKSESKIRKLELESSRPTSPTHKKQKTEAPESPVYSGPPDAHQFLSRLRD